MPLVAKEHPHPFFLNLYRLKIGKDLFHKEAMYKIAVKRLYLPFRLIENDMIIPQTGQYFLFINAYSVFQLRVDNFCYLTNQFVCLVYRHVLAFPARSYSFMLGHTDFVKFFQIR